MDLQVLLNCYERCILRIRTYYIYVGLFIIELASIDITLARAYENSPIKIEIIARSRTSSASRLLLLSQLTISSFLTFVALCMRTYIHIRSNFFSHYTRARVRIYCFACARTINNIIIPARNRPCKSRKARSAGVINRQSMRARARRSL